MAFGVFMDRSTWFHFRVRCPELTVVQASEAVFIDRPMVAGRIYYKSRNIFEPL
jgi:hypothetical protein